MVQIFCLRDNKIAKKLFKLISEDGVVNVKQCLHMLVNNTNLHHEEKFKFVFLLYSKKKDYITSRDLELIVKTNLKHSSKYKENIKKINQLYQNYSSNISIEFEYEYETLFKIYKENRNLFI
jgi:hypothetical protein